MSTESLNQISWSPSNSRLYRTTTKVVNFFISLADSLIVSAQNFFSLTGFKSLESLFFKLQIHFLVDSVPFFWRSNFALNKKTHFKFWHPISREPNNQGKQKKNKFKQKMQLSGTTLRIYEYALLQYLFSSFRSRKSCEETTRLAKGTWNMWNTLSEWPNLRF